MNTDLPDKWIIRTSDRGTFKTCRQKWDFGSKLRQNLEPAKLPAALAFGIAIHSALEVYYDPFTWRKMPTETIEAATTAEFLRVIREQREEVERKQGQLSPEHEEEHKQLKTLGVGMLNHYYRWAPSNDNFTPVRVEQEFEVPVVVPDDLLGRLPRGFTVQRAPNGATEKLESRLYYLDRPVMYQGRLDVLIQDKRDDYWILDHKTAKQFGSTDYLDLDPQVSSYAWAVQQMLGIRVAGVIHSHLKKKAPVVPRQLQAGGLSKAKNQDTTYDVYVAELKRLGLEGDPSYGEILDHLQQKPNTFFRRIWVGRNQRELEYVGRMIVYEAIDMLHEPYIYPNPTMFNCNGCAFFAPCVATQEGSDTEFMLNEMYTRAD